MEISPPSKPAVAPVPPGDARTLQVAVAVLTYRRAATLTQFFDRYCSLQKPAEARVCLIVIDNDILESGRPLFDERCAGLGEARYVVEPRRGIPVARNRALDEARAAGADVLCFIDDDEFPDVGWLAALVATYRKSGAQLVGGPVGIARNVVPLSRWQRVMERSMAARAIRKATTTAEAARRGAKFTVVTNNWLGDLHWLAAHGLRFDEDQLYTGGTDTRFFRAAMMAGGRADWCPTAWVHETILPERLTVAFQFRRSAYQSLNHFAMKHGRLTAGLVAYAVCAAVVRGATGAFVLVVPVHGAASPVIGIRSLGWAAGRLLALVGKRSKLYE